MTRYRQVTEQNGRQHVSTVLLAPDELHEQIEFEERMHLAAGWYVQRFGSMLRCQKQTVVRWIWIRSRTPLEDTLDQPA